MQVLDAAVKIVSVLFYVSVIALIVRRWKG